MIDLSYLLLGQRQWRVRESRSWVSAGCAFGLFRTFDGALESSIGIILMTLEKEMRRENGIEYPTHNCRKINLNIFVPGISTLKPGARFFFSLR